jgi:hypothetical protein
MQYNHQYLKDNLLHLPNKYKKEVSVYFHLKYKEVLVYFLNNNLNNLKEVPKEVIIQFKEVHLDLFNHLHH